MDGKSIWFKLIISITVPRVVWSLDWISTVTAICIIIMYHYNIISIIIYFAPVLPSTEFFCVCAENIHQGLVEEGSSLRNLYEIQKERNILI